MESNITTVFHCWMISCTEEAVNANEIRKIFHSFTTVGRIYMHERFSGKEMLCFSEERFDLVKIFIKREVCYFHMFQVFGWKSRKSWKNDMCGFLCIYHTSWIISLFHIDLLYIRIVLSFPIFLSLYLSLSIILSSIFLFC